MAVHIVCWVGPKVVAPAAEAAYSTASSTLPGVAGGTTLAREPAEAVSISSPELGNRRTVPMNGVVVANV
jgi:hypothetical protein